LAVLPKTFQIYGQPKKKRSSGVEAFPQTVARAEEDEHVCGNVLLMLVQHVEQPPL
jgi:hypothetical protein